MNIEIHYAEEEWAALYVDGKLFKDENGVCVGDSYLAEEKAFSLLGVKVIQDDAFMRGGSSRENVAQDLGEVEEYRAQREKAHARAAQLKAEAERLLEEAEMLEGA